MVSEEKIFVKCWRMDDGVTGILLAHPWAFGSGELKIVNFQVYISQLVKQEKFVGGFMKRWSRQVKYPKEWQLKFGTSYSDPPEQLPRHQLQTDVFSWRNDIIMFKENFNNYCLAKIISVNFSFFLFSCQADLKKMLGFRAPTYPPKTGPTQKMLLSFCESFFYFFVFL